MEKRLSVVEDKTGKLEAGMVGVQRDVEHNTEMLVMTRVEVKEGFAALRRDLNNGVIEKVTKAIQENMPTTTYGQLSGKDKGLIIVAIITSLGAIILAIIR